MGGYFAGEKKSIFNLCGLHFEREGNEKILSMIIITSPKQMIKSL